MKNLGLEVEEVSVFDLIVLFYIDSLNKNKSFRSGKQSPFVLVSVENIYILGIA